MDTTFNDLLRTLYRTSRSCTAADFVPRALERTQALITFDSALWCLGRTCEHLH